MTRSVLACAGMDKSYGSLAREVALLASEALQCEIVCPTLSNIAPTRYKRTLDESILIVIDGCPTRCAGKLAGQIGARIDRRLLLVDILKSYGTTLDPSLRLDSHGIELAQRIVADLVLDITSRSVATDERSSLEVPAEYLKVTHDKFQFQIPARDYSLIIPCSGIGKVHGLIGREATYMIVDELAPQQTETLCLALLVKGDADAVTAVQSHSCITIDGCPKACAQKNVEMAGGTVTSAVRVVDVVKAHRGAQPGSASGLKHDGWAMARELAESVAVTLTGINLDQPPPGLAGSTHYTPRAPQVRPGSSGL